MDTVNTEKTGEGLIYQYAANITITLSGMFFYLYTIHYFSPNVVGLFSLLLAIASLFNIIFSIGFPPAVSHFISYSIGKRYPGDIRKIIKSTIKFGLFLSLISLLFVLIFSNYISDLFFHGEYSFYLKLISVDIFIMILNNFLISVLYGLQKFKYVSIFQSIGNVFSYFSGFIIYHFIPNLYLIVIGWIIGNSIIMVFSAVLILIYSGNIEATELKEYSLKKMMNYAIPIYASSILGYGATYMDRFVVSYFLNLTEFGIYTLAILMVTSFSFVQGPINNVLLPKFSKFFGENDYYSLKLYSSKAFLYVLIISVSLTFIVASLSSWIIIFISNSEYLSATIPFIIISLSESLSLTTSVISSGIQSIRKNRIFVLSSALGILTNVVLSFMLIPHLRLIGAAIAFSSSLIVNFIIILVYAIKLNIFKLYHLKVFKTYVAGTLTFLIIFYIQEKLKFSVIKLFSLIILSFIIYIILIRILKILEKEDMEIINSITPEKLKSVVRILERIILS
ncbi:MAG: flippase [Thermoplasmata archaeon]